MEYDVRQVITQLNRADISMDDRALLTTAILDKLGALPLSAIITNDEQGQLLVHNEPLNIENARILRDSAIQALENQALALIRSQVAFSAITIGIHKAEKVEQMIFGRTALWWGQEVERYLMILAQRNEPTV